LSVAEFALVVFGLFLGFRGMGIIDPPVSPSAGGEVSFYVYTGCIGIDLYLLTQVG
jgi:hypothetical protein